MAGELIEALTGRDYDDVVYARVLAPLGVSGPRLAATFDPGPDEILHPTTLGRNYMETLGGAGAMVGAMAGLNGFAPPAGSNFLEPGIWLALAALFAIVTAFPNTQEIMGRYRPALGVQPRTRHGALLSWRPTQAWSVAVGIVALVALAYVSGTTEFLYFQF